ncbi:hypothetical protein D3C75_1208680 [compost metagenome]
MNSPGVVIGGCRIDRTDSQIIGAVRNRMLCFSQGVGGHANNFMRPKPLADCSRRFILLSDMYPIGIQGDGQLHIIIHNERDAVLPADVLELPCKLKRRCPA